MDKIKRVASAMSLAALVAACGSVERSPTAPTSTETSAPSPAPSPAPAPSPSPSPAPAPAPTPAPTDILSCILNPTYVDARQVYSADNARASAQIPGVSSVTAKTGQWYLFQGGSQPQLRRDISWEVNASAEGKANLEKYLNGVPLTAVDKLYYKPGENKVEMYVAIAKKGTSDVMHPFTDKKASSISRTTFILGGQSFATTDSGSFTKTYASLPACK